MMRGGLLGVVVIIGALYFTDAGPWMLRKVSALGPGCYTALADVGGSMTDPICGAVARVVTVIGQLPQMVNTQVTKLAETLGISDGISVLDSYTHRWANMAAGLRSSQQQLAQMISDGPRMVSTTMPAGQQLQQAVDSFAIGQSYLHDGGSAQKALPWLQAGASAPQGFGLMSQISLAQIYASGQGVPQNNVMAQGYLTQASQSLKVLMGSQSPQAQQLLQQLPASGPHMQVQIERAIKQLQMSVR